MILPVNLGTVISAVLWVVVVLWLFAIVRTAKAIRSQKPLQPLPHDGRQIEGPLVSILVPARNEEHRVLAQSIGSMLSQNYRHFEIIAVNDRSTDGTSSILKKISTQDRLTVIEGEKPPAGWLGKPYALEQAFLAARGSWVLATDADIIFHPRALSTAMALAAKGPYQAVTLIPSIDCLSFWERVFMPAFGWIMLCTLPVSRINDPARSEALGVGGFFLVQSTVLRGIGGYKAVRGEVAEDLEMARTLKRAGVRLRIEYAPDLLRTRMQTNFTEIWHGFTKNLFAGAQFSLTKSIAGGIWLFGMTVFPPAVALISLALTFHGSSSSFRILLPAAMACLAQVSVFTYVNRTWHIPVWYSPASPLGHLLFTAILLNSGYRIISHKGVTWKGRTFYGKSGLPRPRRRNTTRAF